MDNELEKMSRDNHIRTRNAQWAEMWQQLTEKGWITEILWPEGAPNFNEAYGQKQPRLLISPRKDGAPRGIVIVNAGGGFNYKTAREAGPTVEALLKDGFNAAILDYRVKPYEQADAKDDVLRAIRFLRCYADRFNIDSDHIGVLGYSAGGMVSNMAGAHFDYGDPEASDPVERVSSRPDAAVLAYGSMSLVDMKGLPYNREAQNKAAALSSDQNLPVDAPPYFLFQTAQDDPRHCLNLARILADKGIPVEVHLFKDGSHGQTLYDGQLDVENIPHTAHWYPLASEWLREYGF